MIIKGNQPGLLAAVAQTLSGPDSEFAAATWTQAGTGHGRRERRGIRTAPAGGIAWPHAAQVMRIRRDTGPTHGPWTHKDIVYAITSLPPPPGQLRPQPPGHRKPRALPAGQDIQRRSPAGPHRKPAECPRRDPQPGHRRLPPRRVRRIAHAHRWHSRGPTAQENCFQIPGRVITCSFEDVTPAHPTRRSSASAMSARATCKCPRRSRSRSTTTSRPEASRATRLNRSSESAPARSGPATSTRWSSLPG